MAIIEYFAIRHNLPAEKLIWETDVSRVMQLIFCESSKNGNILRYTNSIESESTNRKLEQLERNLTEWQSEQQ